MAKGKTERAENTRDLKIRRATAFDVVNLAKMLIRGRNEQAEEIWYPTVPEGIRGEMLTTQYCLTLIDKAVVYVADLNGRLLGCIGCSVDRFPWTDDWMLTNEWYYVMPQFRDSDIAKALLHAVEAFADADVLPLTGETKPRMPIVMGMISGQQTGVKNRWMEQQGFVNGGGNFVRAPQNVEFQEDNEVHEGAAELADTG